MGTKRRKIYISSALCHYNIPTLIWWDTRWFPSFRFLSFPPFLSFHPKRFRGRKIPRLRGSKKYFFHWANQVRYATGLPQVGTLCELSYSKMFRVAMCPGLGIASRVVFSNVIVGWVV